MCYVCVLLCVCLCVFVAAPACCLLPAVVLHLDLHLLLLFFHYMEMHLLSWAGGQPGLSISLLIFVVWFFYCFIVFFNFVLFVLFCFASSCLFYVLCFLCVIFFNI